MAKKKKNKISPDELLFNFEDWTETKPVEQSLFQQGEQQDNPIAEHQVEHQVKHQVEQPVEQPVEPLVEPQANQPVEKNAFRHELSVGESSASSPTVDLQYMEDTMFWALRQIDGIDDKNQTRLIAMESASVAIEGISPHNIYQLQSFPYGRVDGYQLIALYYTSFAMVFPNMLSGIKLPYAKQFEKAQQRFQEFVSSTAQDA